MTMKAILIPKSSTEPPITLNIDESVSPHLTIALQLSQTGNSYFPVFTQANGTQLEILKIDVVYTGSSDTDFVLWGVTTDGHKPEIEGIQHLASTSMSSQVWWSYTGATGNTIEWVFEDPPVLNTWVSWEFNPSGSTPPVKVKVVLKRQN